MTQEMYNILAADQYVDPIAEPGNPELLQAKNPAVDPFITKLQEVEAQTQNLTIPKPEFALTLDTSVEALAATAAQLAGAVAPPPPATETTAPRHTEVEAGYTPLTGYPDDAKAIAAKVKEVTLKTLAQSESGGNYKLDTNPYGYMGKYQVGTGILTLLGYLEPGAPKSKSGELVNSWMKNPKNWTAKAHALGIYSLTDFLNNERAQDAIMSQNYDHLHKLAQSPKYAAYTNKSGVSREKALGATVSAMHMLGAAGLAREGLNGVDGNKTKGLTWYTRNMEAYKAAGIPDEKAYASTPSQAAIGQRVSSREAAETYNLPKNTPVNYAGNKTLANFGADVFKQIKAAVDSRNTGETGRGEGYFIPKGARPEKVDPRFMHNFRLMAVEYKQLTGKDIVVSDGHRTTAEQAELKRKKGKQAATAGNSNHEYGLAFDLAEGFGNELAKMGLLTKYGFHRPLLETLGEPWHIELKGLSRRQAFGTDPKQWMNPSIGETAVSPGLAYAQKVLPGVVRRLSMPSDTYDNYLASTAARKAHEKFVAEYNASNEGSLNEVLGAVAGAATGAWGLVRGAYGLATLPAENFINQFLDKKNQIDLTLGATTEIIEEQDAFINKVVGYDDRVDKVKVQTALKSLKDMGVDLTSMDSIKSALADPAKQDVVLGAAKEVGDVSLIANSFTSIFGSGGMAALLFKLGKVATVGAKLTNLAEKIGPNAGKAVDRLLTNQARIAQTEIKAIRASETLTAAEKAAKIAEIKKKTTLFEHSKNFVADPMILGYTVDQTHRQAVERQENNNQVEAGVFTVLGMAAANFVAGKMEFSALKSAFKATRVGTAVTATGSTKKAIAMAVVSTAGHIGASITKEGVQEATEAVIETINTKYGTSGKYKDMSVLDLIQAESAHIVLSTIMGMEGGGAVGSVGAAISLAGKGFKGVVNRGTEELKATVETPLAGTVGAPVNPVGITPDMGGDVSAPGVTPTGTVAERIAALHSKVETVKTREAIEEFKALSALAQGDDIKALNEAKIAHQAVVNRKLSEFQAGKDRMDGDDYVDLVKNAEPESLDNHENNLRRAGYTKLADAVAASKQFSQAKAEEVVTNMGEVHAQIMTKGFKTTKNSFLSLKEAYEHISEGAPEVTAVVETQLSGFLTSQRDKRVKLEKLKNTAENKVNSVIDKYAESTGLGREAVIKALAFLSGTTIEQADPNFAEKSSAVRAEVAAAAMKFMSAVTGKEITTVGGANGAFRSSELEAALKEANVTDNYADTKAGKSGGDFTVNYRDIVANLAQAQGIKSFSNKGINKMLGIVQEEILAVRTLVALAKAHRDSNAKLKLALDNLYGRGAGITENTEQTRETSEDSIKDPYGEAVAYIVQAAAAGVPIATIHKKIDEIVVEQGMSAKEAESLHSLADNWNDLKRRISGDNSFTVDIANEGIQEAVNPSKQGKSKDSRVTNIANRATLIMRLVAQSTPVLTKEEIEAAYGARAKKSSITLPAKVTNLLKAFIAEQVALRDGKTEEEASVYKEISDAYIAYRNGDKQSLKSAIGVRVREILNSVGSRISDTSSEEDIKNLVEKYEKFIHSGKNILTEDQTKGLNAFIELIVTGVARGESALEQEAAVLGLYEKSRKKPKVNPLIEDDENYTDFVYFSEGDEDGEFVPALGTPLVGDTWEKTTNEVSKLLVKAKDGELTDTPGGRLDTQRRDFDFVDKDSQKNNANDDNRPEATTSGGFSSTVDLYSIYRPIYGSRLSAQPVKDFINNVVPGFIERTMDIVRGYIALDKGVEFENIRTRRDMARVLLIPNLKTMDIDPQVAVALRIAAIEVLDSAMGTLAAVDEDSIEKYYGVNADNLSKKQLGELNAIGIPAKYLAHEIGKRAKELLGLQRHKDKAELTTIDPATKSKVPFTENQYNEANDLIRDFSTKVEAGIGKKFKKVKGVRRKEALHEFIKDAFKNSEGDLTPVQRAIQAKLMREVSKELQNNPKNKDKNKIIQGAIAEVTQVINRARVGATASIALDERITRSLGMHGLKIAADDTIAGGKGLISLTEHTFGEIAKIIGGPKSKQKGAEGNQAKVYTVVFNTSEMYRGRKMIAPVLAAIAPERRKATHRWEKRTDLDTLTIKIRRNDVTKAPKALVDKVKEYMGYTWRLKTGEFFDKMYTMGANKLKALSGWLEDSDINLLPYDYQGAAHSVNQSITRDVDTLLEAHAYITNEGEEKSKNEIYLDWFISKSLRTMVDSEGLNPQSKKLHRHSMVMDDMVTTVSTEDEKQMIRFKHALAQAFGVSIDKTEPADITKIADALLKISPEDLFNSLNALTPSQIAEFTRDGNSIQLEIEALKGVTEDSTGIVEVKIISHLMDGIEAIHRYQSSEKTGNEFKTQLTVETDGVTNGAFLKMLQVFQGSLTTPVGEAPDATDRINPEDPNSPLKSQLTNADYLAKGGLLVEDNADKNMVEIRAKALIEDNYTTQASKVPLSSIEGSLTTALSEGEEETPGSPFNPVTLTNAVGALTRALVKPAFMIFWYGAGKKKIVTEVADTLMESLARKFTTAADKNTKNKDEKILALMKELQIDHITAEGWRSISMSVLKSRGTFFGVKNPSVETLLTKVLEASYGEAVWTSLENSFEDIIKLNGAVNNAFTTMFNVWNMEYKKRVAVHEAEHGGINDLEKAGIVQDLLYLFPAINSVFSTDPEEKLPVFKTQVVSGSEHSKLGTAGALVKTEAANSVKDSNVPAKTTSALLHVAKMVKEYVDSGVAGSVIPIHAEDSANIAFVKTRMLQIWDALITGIDQTEIAVSEFNQGSFENSMQWNYLEEVDIALATILNTKEGKAYLEELGTKAFAAITEETPVEQVKETAAANAEVTRLHTSITILTKGIAGNKVFKDSLRKTNLSVQHMPYSKESAYTFNGETSLPAREPPTSYLTDKKEVADAVKDLNSGMIPKEKDGRVNRNLDTMGKAKDNEAVNPHKGKPANSSGDKAKDNEAVNPHKGKPANSSGDKAKDNEAVNPHKGKPANSSGGIMDEIRKKLGFTSDTVDSPGSIMDEIRKDLGFTFNTRGKAEDNEAVNPYKGKPVNSLADAVKEVMKDPGSISNTTCE